MSIRLNHTVVYAKNHAASVREFTAVHINSELSIYFMNHDNITLEQHLAFDVDGHFFDLMLNQLKERTIVLIMILLLVGYSGQIWMVVFLKL